MFNSKMVKKMGDKIVESASSLNSKLFRWYASVGLAEGLLTMIWITSIPADTKNVLVFGLSLKRLILLCSTGLGLVGIATILFASLRSKPVSELICGWIEKQALVRLCSVVGLAMALISLMPMTEWGKSGAVFERALPLIAWISLLTLQWSALLLVASGRIAVDVQRILKSHRAVQVPMIILIAGYILSTMLYPQGIKEDYWWETGVPILFWQVILSGALGLIYHKFDVQIKGRLGRKTDISIFTIIFISFGLLWGFSRLTPSYFNPGPFPPNNIYYPYSDAARFDLHAQSTLLGLGFNAGSPLDRPIYPLFIAFIHLISGQNYANNMILQAFLYGVFPAIVYLICTELGSRSWGVLSAAAIGLLGFNAIQANNLLSTSTPKQMLTEFPMAILLSMVLYITIRWLKSGANSGFYACLTGGLLAAAAYVRYSALVLLPIWVIVAVIKYRPAYKRGLIEAALITASFLAFTLPWYARNIAAGQDISIPFTNKVLFVIRHRYQPIATPPISMSITQIVEEDYSLQPTKKANSNDQTDSVTLENNPTNQLSEPFLNWFGPHLVHNLMSSVLILPTSLEVASIKTSLDLGGEIWQQDWNGQLPPFRFIILMLQFFVLSVGLSGLFRRDKTSTLVVILLFGGVQTANALGRTSGGRYIVPVDWLVLLVYFAGFLFLMGKLDLTVNLINESIAGKIVGVRQVVITIIAIMLIGTLPVLYERISMAIFPREESIQTVEELADLPGINISTQDLFGISQFLDQKHANLKQGKVFFPVQRVLDKTDNPPGAFQYISAGTPLTFNLINADGYSMMYFPYQKEIDIQNQDVVYLTGCSIDQWMLIRDMVIVRHDQTMFVQSDLRFDSCKQFFAK